MPLLTPLLIARAVFGDLDGIVRVDRLLLLESVGTGIATGQAGCSTLVLGRDLIWCLDFSSYPGPINLGSPLAPLGRHFEVMDACEEGKERRLHGLLSITAEVGDVG